MRFFRNSVSFIAVMCVCSAASAALVASSSGRVGVIGSTATASRRLPSLSNVIKTTTGTTTTTTSGTTTDGTTGTGLLSDPECIDDYRECMKSDTACGPEFEECTTNVLFHGHMGECFSTLYQCSAAAINRLFGTSNLSALSSVSSYVAGTNNTEVSRYTYPTDGSVMGIDIIGAATRNKLSTADCVKKYKRCLNKDNVCGEDFELCTSDSEFKRQAAMCDSTLARCQKEGFQQLFGVDVTTKPSNKNLVPKSDGDIRSWINDGATLAAANAVNTCYKVVDNCFANACAENPYSCVEDVDWTVVNSAQSIVNSGVIIDTVDYTNKTGRQMAADVRKFFRTSCTDTIGSNQYCFMTFNDGKKPTKTDLADEDLREDIFGEAYATRKTILNTKVNELAKTFDTTARQKCIETFKSCAVRSCGGGSGAACYSRVFGDQGDKSINGNSVYSDIENGCAAVVNADANCRFMAAMQGANNTYTYEMGGTTDTFAILFPHYDSMGRASATSQVVAALNADLSTAYNAAAIENMKKQCSNVVSNCVKSMCGTDYQNCYRNRNDIRVSTYATDSDNFNKSMNRVGGVLDYTIVQGLCMSTVKSADACAESLAIAKVGIRDAQSDTTAGWGDGKLTTLSNAWRDSSTNYGYNTVMTDYVQKTDANGNKICTCTNGTTDVCGYDNPNIGNNDCQEPYMIEQDVQLSNAAATTLFQTVLADIETEVQAKYNAKLTHEQNVCLAQNTMSNPSASFVWAKLKGGKMSSDYSVKGLGENGSVPSNDLYNSFCRVKVTLQSDDKDIQNLLAGNKITVTEVRDGAFGIDGLARDKTTTVGSGKNETTAYFAVGDNFTCGLWVSDETLDAISQKVAANARKDAGQGSQRDRNVKLWTTLGAGVLGTAGSYIGMNALQTNGYSLGGLLRRNTSEKGYFLTSEQKRTADQCVTDVEAELTRLNGMTTVDTTTMNSIRTNANRILQSAQDINIATRIPQFQSASTTKNYDWLYKSDDSVWDCCGTNTTTCPGDVNVIKAILDKEPSENNVKLANDKVSALKISYKNVGLCQGLPSNLSTTTDRWSKENIVSTYKTNLEELKDECTAARDGVETEEDRKSRLTRNLVAAGIGGVATTFLANGIVSSAQKAKYETAANDAVRDWMNNIGSKIHCYVGTNQIGSFGDIIGVEITEE